VMFNIYFTICTYILRFSTPSDRLGARDDDSEPSPENGEYEPDEELGVGVDVGV